MGKRAKSVELTDNDLEPFDKDEVLSAWKEESDIEFEKFKEIELAFYTVHRTFRYWRTQFILVILTAIISCAFTKYFWR